MVFSFKDRRATLFDEGGRFGAFSHDGHWVAYTGREGMAAMPLFIQPFPPTGAKHQIWANGYYALWSNDGKELFTVSRAQPEGVKVTTHPTLAFSTPVRMQFSPPMVGTGPLVQSFDIMPDGQHFVILVNADRRPWATEFQVVLNWVDELKRRVAER
jgi:hypothetical protein